MKLRGLIPGGSSISSAESAEALTLLRSSPCGPEPSGDGASYGGSVQCIHPWAYARGLLRRRINRRLNIDFEELPAGRSCLSLRFQPRSVEDFATVGVALTRR